MLRIAFLLAAEIPNAFSYVDRCNKQGTRNKSGVVKKPAKQHLQGKVIREGFCGGIKELHKNRNISCFIHFMTIFSKIIKELSLIFYFYFCSFLPGFFLYSAYIHVQESIETVYNFCY
jgi:hypothetical protein